MHFLPILIQWYFAPSEAAATTNCAAICHLKSCCVIGEKLEKIKVFRRIPCFLAGVAGLEVSLLDRRYRAV